MTKKQLQKAKPIIFDTESVRAILDGRKTATRQVIKNASPKWTFDCLCDDAAMTVIDRNGNEKAKEVDGLWATFCATDEHIEFPMIKAKYQVGDVLYVRETFLPFGRDVIYCYKADNKHIELEKLGIKFKWRPSIHMPKEAARIFLEVTGVRVERLQDITEEQAIKEGVQRFNTKPDETFGFTKKEVWFESPLYCIKGRWNSKIHKKDLDKYGWEANPFVFVYEFKRVEVEE